MSNVSTVNPTEMELLNKTEQAFIDGLECPFITKAQHDFRMQFAFWTEGVAILVLGLLGLVGNIFSSFVLARKTMRNSFNLLLIVLAIYDNTYLVCSILQSFRKQFGLDSDLHTILFPWFLYPMQMMAMTGSILMTVAIALERYVAVHYPINYNQAMNDSRALKNRLLKYLVPVFIMTILSNISKFFEITIVYVESEGNIEVTNGTTVGLKPQLKVTDLRRDPTYSISLNWFRFITVGVIPFLLLIFFNFKIYMDIKRRGIRKALRRGNCPRTATMTATYNQTTATKSGRTEETAVVVVPPQNGNGEAAAAAVQENSCLLTGNEGSCSSSNGDQNANDNTAPRTVSLANGSVSSPGQNSAAIEMADIEVRCMEEDSVAGPTNGQPTDTSPSSRRTNGRGRLVQTSVVAANDARRRVESNLAAIMMGYVLMFLICNLPRLMLNIHELAHIR